MEAFMQIVLAFVALNFIMIVHELGHFIAAKKFGIKVLEFSLFIGPKIFSITRGETQYTLRLFPIIAYVKMEGEEEVSGSDRAFYKKPLYARAIVAAAGSFANILSAVVILTIIFSIMGYQTNTLDAVGKDSPAAKIGLQKGDTIVKYGGKSVLQPTDALTFLYATKGKPSEITVKRNGHIITSSITPEIIPASEAYKIGFSPKEDSGPDSNVVDSITPDMPGGKAGLKVNDRIVALDEKEVSSRQEISEYMKIKKGSPVQIRVLRNGVRMSLGTIIPEMQKIQENYDIGVAFASENGNIIKSLSHSMVFAYSNVKMVLYTLGWLFTGQVPASQLMGPVGLVNTISDVVNQSSSISLVLVNLFTMISIFSIAIGATNLIPFPALDGGKLFLLAVEGVRRKPIPLEKEAYITAVGFVLIILLAVFTFYNDILRIVRGG
jgi:regulator of sigma E protease